MNQETVGWVLTARDEAIARGSKKEAWDELVYDLMMGNLYDYLMRPDEYKKTVEITRTDRTRRRRIKVSNYTTCGICCRDDCGLDDNCLCGACEWKTEYKEMLRGVLHKMNRQAYPEN